MGAAGTKIPTTRVPAYRCNTRCSGWLDDVHPTVEVGEVHRKVCFSGLIAGCKESAYVSVKNCGSYFIYNFNRQVIVPHATVAQTEHVPTVPEPLVHVYKVFNM